MTGNILKYISKRGIALLWLVALLFIALSFIEFSSSESMNRQVALLEKKIHERQAILDEYSELVRSAPHSEFVRFDNFPEDMIIYRYFDDTLQSWINEFPIADDNTDFYSFAHSLYHMNSRSIVANPPLATLLADEQYVNLGSAWYIVSKSRKFNQTLIAALQIKTDYPTENSALVNRINPRLHSGESLSIVSIAYDEAYIVRSKSGQVLFSVLQSLPDGVNRTGIILRWIAILLIIFALFLDLIKERSIKKFLFLIFGLAVVTVVSFYQSAELQGKLEIFSPSLYADSGFFKSLGNLLICNLVIFLAMLALFMVRRSVARIILKRKYINRYLSLPPVITVPLIFMIYIHLSLKSLILNSSIVMDIYKIDEISIYTLIVYVSYGLLFLSMIFSLQFMRPLLAKRVRVSFMSIKPIFIFTILVSLYMVFVIRHFGIIKEFNQNRVLATKISIDRDINTELLLRDVENMIANDHFLAISIMDRDENYARSRLAEDYLWNVLQRYNMEIITCNMTDLIFQGTETPYCWSKFNEDILREGTSLGDRSNFYYMNKNNGRMNYLGAFRYYMGGVHIYSLFIELESKFIRESIGYPDILLNYRSSENYNMPSGYSYSKYLNSRLSSFWGSFNYPIYIDPTLPLEYRMSRSDGYVHFTNKLSSDNVVIVSRKDMGGLPYILSFSYLMLFYSLLIIAPVNIRKRRIMYMIPRNTFRWKISVLIIASLVIALICMGAGSIWFTVRYLDENNMQQMMQKLHTAQSALTYHSKDAVGYNDQAFNNITMLNTINNLSTSTEMDINVYGANGLLLRTTRIEVFDRFLVGKRINSEAYKEIVYNQKKQYMHREKIGDISYYSLYAPLYSNSGKLIAIVNIPYFAKQNDFSRDTSSIIAAIINIYLLLLIAAVFLGTALANSVSRPLAEIRRKMGLLDITKQPEHINYSNKDELGGLVNAYNKMVDVLNESTLRLAQGEREQAWREMARQIAHEIKNPLTPMRLSIQHLMRLKAQGIEDWPVRFDNLANSLIEQIDILSDAAGEFSSFSRFYSEESTSFELKEIIEEQLVLFDTDDNIEILLESELESTHIVARKNQIVRVFVNLISNAVQAVDGQNGIVIISVSKKRQMYIISIEDNGPGVQEGFVNKLFKPNFTTKSGGTGLGLAICRSIIEQSKGKISYKRSEFLGGAAFIIEIPEE